MSTIGKALSLLNLFTQSRLELRLSDVARLSGMDKATVHRHLTELKNAGILEQTGPEKIYRMGPEVLRLANIRESAVPMLVIAKQILEELSDTTCETTHMSLLKNETLVTVAHNYSNAHATGVMMGDKNSHPLHATSSGLAVLANLPSTFIEKILNAPLPSYTPHTLTDPDKIKSVLAEIRAMGFSESFSGFEANLHSFAAPIFNANARVIGALSVTAPADRVGEHNKLQTSNAVIEAAAKLTRQTGGLPRHLIAESSAA